MRWPRASVVLSAIVVLQLIILWRGPSDPPTCPPPPPAPVPWSPMRRIGVLVVATGRYVSFVPQLLADLSANFLVGYDVTTVLFTDELHPPACAPPRCRVIPHQRYGWPYDTLLRWEDFDFLFAIDADMRVEGAVGSEILGPLVGVLHPAYYSAPPADFTYERANTASAAYVPPGEGHHYFAGGVNGGQRAAFLDMARAVSQGARRDLSNGGFVARWHDESHVNRYFLTHPPPVILSPAYCYPQSWKLPFPRKIIALDKNHAAMRKAP